MRLHGNVHQTKTPTTTTHTHSLADARRNGETRIDNESENL